MKTLQHTSRAIDQLGATDNEGKNKKLETRLGGIYALERIAVDYLAMESSPGKDYSTVMEVLAAYVRENTTQVDRNSKEPSKQRRTSFVVDVEDPPKRTKGRSSRVLPLTSKRSWMYSDARKLAHPRNSVLASIFMKPTSEEQTSVEPTSKMPMSAPSS